MDDKEQTDEFSLILASSVHDMKNSLGMLLSSLEEVITETEAKNDRQSKQFATLQYEASRINGELIQLLSVYRMQKDRLPVVIDEHYVSEVLEDLLTRNETLFSTRGAELNIVCESDLIWYFDIDMVTSVLNDALVNCSRYTKDKVSVYASVIDDALQFHISDNGAGFPVAMLGEQNAAMQSSVYDNERTNLGLYFAARVAGLHQSGGKSGKLILANNGKMGGGDFILVLP